jgi:Uma2 family endonuclease
MDITVTENKNKYYTEDDLLSLSGRYELVKGELREMAPSGFEHGLITSKLHYLLASHIYSKNLGKLTAAETGFKLSSNPDTVRAADIAFIRKENLDKTKIIKGYGTIIPDLVVEVISPTDIYLDVEEKITDWLTAGVKMVWIINPRKKTVSVYSEPAKGSTLYINDELSGHEVIPDFKCKVSEIFL